MLFVCILSLFLSRVIEIIHNTPELTSHEYRRNGFKVLVFFFLLISTFGPFHIHKNVLLIRFLLRPLPPLSLSVTESYISSSNLLTELKRV